MRHGRAAAVSMALWAGIVAAEEIDLGAPAIARLTAAMTERHARLMPLYDSGAVALARNGGVVLRDASVLGPGQRQAAATLVAEENADRGALYRELARASGNPGWEPDIRATFGQRWIDRAPSRWWVQGATGAWQQKP